MNSCAVYLLHLTFSFTVVQQVVIDRILGVQVKKQPENMIFDFSLVILNMPFVAPKKSESF